jgi:PilZ domain
VTQETRHGRILVDRAVRHELRIPMRYRPEGRQDWCVGESINMSESGILFSSNEMLELDTRLEITFQTSGAPLLQSSTRQALVVRRTLSNWPETRLVFGARFRS